MLRSKKLEMLQEKFHSRVISPVLQFT